MKKLSNPLGTMWESDPNKSLWSLLAKAWSIMRDQVGKDNVPLHDFFQLICPHLNIPPPETYLEEHGWKIILDNEHGPRLTRHPLFDPTTMNVGVCTAEALSVEDVITYCQNSGYAQDFKGSKNANSATFLAHSQTLCPGNTSVSSLSERLDTTASPSLPKIMTWASSPSTQTIDEASSLPTSIMTEPLSTSVQAMPGAFAPPILTAVPSSSSQVGPSLPLPSAHSMTTIYEARANAKRERRIRRDIARNNVMAQNMYQQVSDAHAVNLIGSTPALLETIVDEQGVGNPVIDDTDVAFDAQFAIPQIVTPASHEDFNVPLPDQDAISANEMSPFYTGLADMLTDHMSSNDDNMHLSLDDAFASEVLGSHDTTLSDWAAFRDGADSNITLPLYYPSSA